MDGIYSSLSISNDTKWRKNSKTPERKSISLIRVKYFNRSTNPDRLRFRNMLNTDFQARIFENAGLSD